MPELILLENRNDFVSLIQACLDAKPLEIHNAAKSVYSDLFTPTANLGQRITISLIDSGSLTITTCDGEDYQPALMEPGTLFIETDFDTSKLTSDGLSELVSALHASLPSNVEILLLAITASDEFLNTTKQAFLAHGVERIAKKYSWHQSKGTNVFFISTREPTEIGGGKVSCPLVVASIRSAHLGSYSVLMPVFNHYPIVYEAIKSVENAARYTSSEIEIILVDDGSDSPPDSISSSLPIKYVKQYKNGGVATALNAGLEIASSKWICWLSADDLFLTSYFTSRNLFFSIFLKTNLLFGNPCSLEVSTGKISFTRYGTKYLDRSFLIPKMIDNNPVNGITATYSRIDFRQYRFDPIYRHAQDVKFWATLAIDSRANILCLPATTTVSRLHSTSYSYTHSYACKSEALIGVIFSFAARLTPITGLDTPVFVNQIFDIVDSIGARNRFEQQIVIEGLLVMFRAIDKPLLAELGRLSRAVIFCRPHVGTIVTQLERRAHSAETVDSLRSRMAQLFESVLSAPSTQFDVETAASLRKVMSRVLL